MGLRAVWCGWVWVWARSAATCWLIRECGAGCGVRGLCHLATVRANAIIERDDDPRMLGLLDWNLQREALVPFRFALVRESFGVV